MTRMQWLYAAFWIFIGTMLFIQFHNYNKKLDHAIAAAGPKQEHFFYLNAKPVSTLDAPPKADGADVKQISVGVENGVPSQGFFTYNVTLKNEGNRKATHVQVQVFPYRGILVSNDSDADTQRAISDDDPTASINQWISFTDLSPGESKTEGVSFPIDLHMTPGSNPRPNILFESEKSPPAPAPPAKP